MHLFWSIRVLGFGFWILGFGFLVLRFGALGQLLLEPPLGGLEEAPEDCEGRSCTWRSWKPWKPLEPLEETLGGGSCKRPLEEALGSLPVAGLTKYDQFKKTVIKLVFHFQFK